MPIDSKFPLESFQRLLAAPPEEQDACRKKFYEVVKKHIDVIAGKYIQPQAGTYDFALAYLPAENVYYEAVVRPQAGLFGEALVDYAASRKVVLVSPNTFYAYLLTVAYGLKGMRIEQRAAGMRQEIENFSRRFAQFYQSFTKVGRNLELAHRGFDEARRAAGRLQDVVGGITGGDAPLDDEPSVVRAEESGATVC